MTKLWSGGSSSDGRAPLSKYWGVSVTNTIGPTMGIEALKYINYPAQVWFRLLLPSHLGCYMHCPGHCVMLMLGSCRGHMGNIVTDAYGLRCSDRVNWLYRELFGSASSSEHLGRTLHWLDCMWYGDWRSCAVSTIGNPSLGDCLVFQNVTLHLVNESIKQLILRVGSW